MVERTVSSAIKHRRSIRIFQKTKLDDEKVKGCIYNATLAPNSSNLQLWEFIHVTDSSYLKKLSKACLNQNAASTASQLVVIVVRKDLWNKRAKQNVQFLKDQFKNHPKKHKRIKTGLKYYTKIIPALYFDFLGIFGSIKYIIFQVIGLFTPIIRQVSNSNMRIVAHKSAGLAAQNFMISMAAIDYDTCPMEGFDSLMVKKTLGLPRGAEINMIISCGLRDEKGIYGTQFRIPFDKVYKYI
jgi:nitroreductase